MTEKIQLLIEQLMIEVKPRIRPEHRYFTIDLKDHQWGFLWKGDNFKVG